MSAGNGQRGYVVGICGGRALDDKAMVYGEMNRLLRTYQIDLLVSGGCPPRTDDEGNVIAMSADRLAEEWARENEIDTLIRYAKWTKHGRSAGPIRNSKMAADEPDIWVSFPGGSGTADMTRKARAAGCRVIEVGR